MSVGDLPTSDTQVARQQVTTKYFLTAWWWVWWLLWWHDGPHSYVVAVMVALVTWWSSQFGGCYDTIRDLWVIAWVRVMVSVMLCSSSQLCTGCDGCCDFMLAIWFVLLFTYAESWVAADNDGTGCVAGIGAIGCTLVVALLLVQVRLELHVPSGDKWTSFLTIYHRCSPSKCGQFSVNWTFHRGSSSKRENLNSWSARFEGEAIKWSSWDS